MTKLVCMACLTQNIYSANFMINNPETPNDILLVIKNQTESLSGEHSSLKNVFIFEYLTFKNELAKISNEPKLKYSSIAPFKYNSSLRLYRNYFDEWIAIEENKKAENKLRIWPALYPNIPVKIHPDGRLDSLYYRIYNPVGDFLLETIVPALEKIISVKTKLQIHADLLKIVLNKRLGQEVDLKARAYSDEYIINIENKKIVSPGPDGKEGTRDDISLPINPEVLGLG